MDCLARREHSCHELLEKLRLKFSAVSPSTLLGVIKQLQSENLQSDERFVEAFVRHRKNRGFAYLHIRPDLARRGVSQELIDRYLFPDDDDWGQIAENLVSRRAGAGAVFEYGSREHRRLHRLLESRGFPPAVTRKVLTRHIAAGRQRDD